MYVILLTIHGLAISAVKEVSKLVNKAAYSTVHNVIKSMLKLMIFEPVVYGDLDYKFKTIVGRSNFSDSKCNQKYKKLDITWLY